MIRLREIISEYSDEEKQQMGIPPDAESRGGKWYVGDRYVGKVVDGKFQPAIYDKQVQRPRDSDPAVYIEPETTVEVEDYPTLANAEQLPAFDMDGRRSSASDLWRQIISKVGSEFEVKSEDELQDELEYDADHHRSEIETDSDAKTAVILWQDTSVWERPSDEREYIFNEIDRFVTSRQINVSKTLYRGIHFYSSRSYNKKFVTEILNNYAVGNTIHLPPSGFSLNLLTAMNFASPGPPVLSIIFVITPKKNPVRAIYVWGGRTQYSDEFEAITKRSNYKVLNVQMQQIDNTPDTYGRLQSSIHLYIELEQEDSVNEDASVIKSPYLDILFGDNMRNTAKNLKRLSK